MYKSKYLDPGSKVLAESSYGTLNLYEVWCGVVWCGVVWCGVARVRCVVQSLAHAARKAHLDEVQGATALRVLLMVYPFGSSPGSCESPAVGSRHASQLAPAEQPH